jgi:hypothetical protein
VQSAVAIDGDSCTRWHFAQSVVACCTTAAAFPWVFEWHPTQLAAGASGLNVWQEVQAVASEPGPPLCMTAAAFAWQAPQTAVPGSLNPPCATEWQALHAM